MKDDIKQYFNKYNVSWTEISEIESILPEVDVIYQTRVQKERFENNPQIYEDVIKSSEKLILTKKNVMLMKKNACIMHPLPRTTEISYAVDNDPRAIYFQQAQNGLFIRMALLKMILIGY